MKVSIWGNAYLKELLIHDRDIGQHLFGDHAALIGKRLIEGICQPQRMVPDVGDECRQNSIVLCSFMRQISEKCKVERKYRAANVRCFCSKKLRHALRQLVAHCGSGKAFDERLDFIEGSSDEGKLWSHHKSQDSLESRRSSLPLEPVAHGDAQCNEHSKKCCYGRGPRRPISYLKAKASKVRASAFRLIDRKHRVLPHGNARSYPSVRAVSA